MTDMTRKLSLALALAGGSLIVAACAANAAGQGAEVAHVAPASSAVRAAGSPTPTSLLRASGYLPAGGAPDSLLINPLPPAPGSAALARDEEAASKAVALRGTPRWQQAVIDADLFTPKSTDAFSCAVGFSISAEATPRINTLMRRVGPDLALAVYPSKRKYQRARPFMSNNQPVCTPEMEDMLRKDGSYPSGHSAIGYGWGLILAELVPDRAAQIVARGRAFGDSRRVCNVHWQSDVEEGYVIATAVVARLHGEAAFRADVDAARAEVAAARASASKPDCVRENLALGNN
jgi:acid phosphatase (class A)